MVTRPLHRQLPAAVKSPPRQFSALVLTQTPPLPEAAGSSLNSAGQVHAPPMTVPPSQAMVSTDSRIVVVNCRDGLGLTSATQAPASRCVLAGQAHRPSASAVPPLHWTDGAGTPLDVATQAPSRNS